MANKPSIDPSGGVGSDVTVTQSGVNESTPLKDRVQNKQTTLDAGPKIGERGEYLPARYLAPAVQVQTPAGIVNVAEGRVIEDR